MIMTQEIWKPIKGYECIYECSNLGNVKSLSRLKKGVRYGKPYEYETKEMLLSQQIDNKGYLRVKLQKDGKIETKKVHRLVAETFIGDIYNKEIDHKNTIKTDNRVENLRIVTSKENANNPLTREKNKKSSMYKVAKPIKCILENGETMFFFSMNDAVESGYATNASGISMCCKGKKKTHNNKRWEYYN